MLKTYKTCNSTVGFSKYEFYNKLLDDITLLRVTSGVTWTQPYIYISFIYIYIYMLKFAPTGGRKRDTNSKQY